MTTPATPLSHATYLTICLSQQCAYLSHTDRDARLKGLYAIYDALETCFRQENALSVRVTDAAPDPEPHRVRELVRRFLS